MKICDVRATPVRVRRRTRFLPRTAHGEVAASEYVIIELLTDDDHVGLGEVTCSPRWNGEEAPGSTALLRGAVRDTLVGADPSAWFEVAQRLDSVFKDRPFLRAGVEMACLDLVGRTHGLSVSSLLGGPVRQQIPTKFVLPARRSEEVRAMALDLKGTGVSRVKVKVGLGVEDDLARVASVREVFGSSAILTVDANEGWSPEEARRAVIGLSDSDVVAIEQPLPRAASRAGATLRSLSTAAIVADESVWGMPDLATVLSTGGFDVVSLYPGKCGGLRRTIAMAEAAAGMGLGVTFGSNLELGIGAAALAHTIAASPVLSNVVATDLIGPLYFESSLITDDNFVRWGDAALPPGEGLGVYLDPEALAAHRMDI
jgi:L-alanine-DL-glutamate epimerase-like enolase superfamily enzyme